MPSKKFAERLNNDEILLLDRGTEYYLYTRTKATLVYELF